jgi:hypothetical protein
MLDWAEVGEVFRQEHEAGSDIADRLAHRLSFVGADIVEDDDVVRLQRRREELIDIGAESVKQVGRVDLRSAARKVAVPAGPCRRAAGTSAPSRACGSCWSSSRFHREDQPRGVDEPLIGAPSFAVAAYVRAILLARDKGLF